jgi:hypothetical protein
MDLRTVIQRVIFGGRSVRARTLDGTRDGSFAFQKRAISSYWVAPEFRELVQHAPIAPVASLPGGPDATSTSPEIGRPESRAAPEWVEPAPPSTFEALAAAAEIEADVHLRDAPETMRRALINARIGQGGYRRRMLQLWGGRCALSGVGVAEVLVASHAKTWADSTNEERLDEYNGLLLAGTLDKLFDAGLISFDDQGRLLTSAALQPSELSAMGCSESMRLRSIDPRHGPYLREHRQRNGFE